MGQIKLEPLHFTKPLHREEKLKSAQVKHFCCFLDAFESYSTYFVILLKLKICGCTGVWKFFFLQLFSFRNRRISPYNFRTRYLVLAALLTSLIKSKLESLKAQDKLVVLLNFLTRLSLIATVSPFVHIDIVERASVNDAFYPQVDRIHSWQSLIPNSQVIVIPFPPDKPAEYVRPPSF